MSVHIIESDVSVNCARAVFTGGARSPRGSERDHEPGAGDDRRPRILAEQADDAHVGLDEHVFQLEQLQAEMDKRLTKLNGQFRREGRTIRLDPANSRYEAQRYDESRVSIQGRLAGLIRRY